MTTFRPLELDEDQVAADRHIDGGQLLEKVTAVSDIVLPSIDLVSW
jgi:hypothetical protein